MTQGRKPEHSREQILEKGMELFSKQGYHATGLNTILEACQVSKGSFYNFFGSKEQFAVEIIEHYHSIKFERWKSLLQSMDCPRLDRLKIMLELQIEELETTELNSGCLIANISGELGNTSEGFKEAIRASSKRVLNALEADFKLCQEDGTVRDDIEAASLAYAFWDSWQGALLRMKVDSSTKPLRKMLHFYWTYILPPQTGNHHS